MCDTKNNISEMQLAEQLENTYKADLLNSELTLENIISYIVTRVFSFYTQNGNKKFKIKPITMNLFKSDEMQSSIKLVSKLWFFKILVYPEVKIDVKISDEELWRLITAVYLTVRNVPYQNGVTVKMGTYLF